MTEEQIVAQELAKAQRGNPVGKEVDEDNLYKKLSEDFSEDAMQPDTSRGFALTSVKAQYVIERLNEVFGFMNWTFGGEYKETEEGVLFMGSLIVSVNGKQNRQFAPGYCDFESKTGKKKLLGDVYKSAHTDSLSKSASKFGVANSVFKGLVDAKSLDSPSASTARSRKKSSTKNNSSVKSNESVDDVKPTSFKARSRRRRNTRVEN